MVWYFIGDNKWKITCPLGDKKLFFMLTALTRREISYTAV